MSPPLLYIKPLSAHNRKDQRAFTVQWCDWYETEK